MEEGLGVSQVRKYPLNVIKPRVPSRALDKREMVVHVYNPNDVWKEVKATQPAQNQGQVQETLTEKKNS